MIRLQCVCGRKMAAPDQWLGKRVKCPQCGQPVAVVHAETTPAATQLTEEAPRDAATLQSRAEIRRVAAPQISDEPISANSSPATNEGREESSENSDLSIEPSPVAVSQAAGPAQRRPVAPRATAGAAPISTFASSASAGESMPPDADDKDDFYEKQKLLPRLTGTLGLLVAIGAGASCWFPPYDGWTLYIALAGVAISTMGLGLSMSRYRLGLAMPVLGLIASLAVMGFPHFLPFFGKITPQHYVDRGNLENEQQAQAEAESQRRGLLSVESLRLTGNKDTLVPELAYKLINRSGKTIKQITGSLQLSDREHRPLGGLVLNLVGPYEPNGVIEGKNEWTMQDAAQSAIADKHFTAEYKADQIEYTDGTTKNYNE